MERPDAEEILVLCRRRDTKADAEATTCFPDRPRLLPTGPAAMSRWRTGCSGFMACNAGSVTDISSDRVVGLGARVEF